MSYPLLWALHHLTLPRPSQILISTFWYKYWKGGLYLKGSPVSFRLYQHSFQAEYFLVLDLARLISAFAPSAYTEQGQCIALLNALFSAAEWSEPWSLPHLPKSRETNVLLTLRSVANVFQQGENGSISPSILNCIPSVSYNTITPRML